MNLFFSEQKNRGVLESDFSLNFGSVVWRKGDDLTQGVWKEGTVHRLNSPFFKSRKSFQQILLSLKIFQEGMHSEFWRRDFVREYRTLGEDPRRITSTCPPDTVGEHPEKRPPNYGEESEDTPTRTEAPSERVYPMSNNYRVSSTKGFNWKTMTSGYRIKCWLVRKTLSV